MHSGLTRIVRISKATSCNFVRERRVAEREKLEHGFRRQIKPLDQHALRLLDHDPGRERDPQSLVLRLQLFDPQLVQASGSAGRQTQARRAIGPL